MLAAVATVAVVPVVRLFVASGLVAALVPTGLAAAAAAEEPGVTIATDKNVYTPPTDAVAVLSVSGLSGCAGKIVQLGLFSDAADARTALISSVVDNSGRVSAQVPLPANNIVVLHAGVTGNACVPGGTVVSPQQLLVQELDAKQPPPPAPSAPAPPQAGTGSSPIGGSSNAFVIVGDVAVVLALVSGAWAWALSVASSKLDRPR
jgi:hypothetical protein